MTDYAHEDRPNFATGEPKVIEKCDFKDKVRGTLAFIKTQSNEQLAEHIVRQQEAIEGLVRNNNAYTHAFRAIQAGRGKDRQQRRGTQR